MALFSSDHNIETIAFLIKELKHYIQLKGESLQLSMVSKLSVLRSTLVLCILFLMFGSIIVLFLSYTLAEAIASWSGVPAIGYACIVLLYLLISLLIYSKRHTWIQVPISNFLANLFLKNDENTPNHEADE